MNNKQNLKLGFRTARVEEEIQQAVNKEDTTRLNVEIRTELAYKIKLQALKEKKTIKDLINDLLEDNFK